MERDDPLRTPQSWEHLLEKEPHGASRFGIGIVAAALIHGAIFAVTWPTVAEAPPAEPERELIPFPLVDFSPPERSPEPIPFDVPAGRPEDPPVVSLPPEVESATPSIVEIERPPGPAVVAIPVDPPAPPPEADPPPVIVRASVEVDPPEVVHEVRPLYTEAARRAGVQGVVILELVIGTDGAVESVRVLRGLPLGLTQNAVDAVRQWRFRPSAYRDHPVRVRYVLTVRFTLG